MYVSHKHIQVPMQIRCYQFLIQTYRLTFCIRRLLSNAFGDGDDELLIAPPPPTPRTSGDWDFDILLMLDVLLRFKLLVGDRRTVGEILVDEPKPFPAFWPRLPSPPTTDIRVDTLDFTSL